MTWITRGDNHYYVDHNGKILCTIYQSLDRVCHITGTQDKYIHLEDAKKAVERRYGPYETT